MICEFRTVYFRHILKEDGTIAAESFFRLKSDAENVSDARSEALAWAGKTGESLKIGGGGQNTFEYHTDFVLESLELKELDFEFAFELKLFGRSRTADWMLLPGSRIVSDEKGCSKELEYTFSGTNPPAMPAIGEIIKNTDGCSFICCKSEFTDDGGGHFRLKLGLKDTNHEELISVNDIYRGDRLRRVAILYWSKEKYGTNAAALRFWDESFNISWAEGFVLEKMESRSDDECGHYVELTACKIENKLISITRNEDGDTQKASAVYHFKKNETGKFKNIIGTPADFIEGDYIIESVREKELDPLTCEITLDAVELTGKTQLGNTVIITNSDGTATGKAEFFVPAGEAAEYRENLALNTPADWAGENFYLNSWQEKNVPHGIIFELTAAEISTRMLSMSQTERFTGCSSSGSACTEIIAKSIWQVHIDDINDFNRIAGQQASWWDSDNIITSVRPEKVSDIEYRIEIEAQLRSNPDLCKSYNSKDNEILSNRIDLNCELIDFRFSAKDCGYYLHNNGNYSRIPVWYPDDECPLKTNSELPKHMINCVIKILRLSETIYKRGSLNKNIDDMILWGQTRVFNGNVGNYRGSYLKNDLFAKEIYDNNGVQWTKITKVYDLAPENTEWNLNYFTHKKH